MSGGCGVFVCVCVLKKDELCLPLGYLVWEKLANVVGVPVTLYLKSP